MTGEPARRSSALYPWIASPLHLMVVILAEALIAWRGAVSSAQLRLADHPNLFALYGRTLATEWLMLALVLVGLRRHGAPFSTVLGERWRSLGQVFRDIGVSLLFWVVSTVTLSMISLHAHGDTAERAVHFLLPRTGLEMMIWTLLAITAGICEEAVYRGYLQRQFSALAGNAAVGVIISAVAFGGAHAYKGLRGAAEIALQGAMLGLLALWRKSVRPGMVAHAWGDFFGGVLARLLGIKVG